MGIVVLDASVLIAFLEIDDVHHAAAVAALASAKRDDLVLPATALAETLIRPLRAGARAAAAVDSALDALGVYVAPVTDEIARVAAGLRAGKRALPLGDAIVVATGEVLRADRVLTADRRWRGATRRVVLIEP